MIGIISFLLIAFTYGFIFFSIYRKKHKSKTIAESFFLADRSISWWQVGLSLVSVGLPLHSATAIVINVMNQGVAASWKWQTMLVGSLFMSFFIARFLRRVEVTTELEIIELRYSGTLAKYLRMFKAFYFGFFVISVIIAWINKSIIELIDHFSVSQENNILIFLLLYSASLILVAVTGYRGVVMSGIFHFILLLLSSITVALIIINNQDIVTFGGLQKSLPEWMFSFIPRIVDPELAPNTLNTGVYEISDTVFFVYVIVQWWAVSSIGIEGANSSIAAQRVMSAKNEKHALFGMLLFVVIHYSWMFWPWVLLGLATVHFYSDFLVESFFNVISYKVSLIARVAFIVGCISVYISVVCTYLNLGASYLYNDLYKRVKLNSLKNKLMPSFFVLVLGGIAFSITFLKDEIIENFWLFFIQCSAGSGFVGVMRWFWWKINIWSELLAFIMPAICFFIFLFFDYPPPLKILISTIVTVVACLIAAIYGSPEKIETLERFYERAKIDSLLWRKVSSNMNHVNSEKGYGYWILDWILGSAMVYCAMFGIGRIILGESLSGVVMILVSLTSAMLLFIDFERRGWAKTKTSKRKSM